MKTYAIALVVYQCSRATVALAYSALVVSRNRVRVVVRDSRADTLASSSAGTVVSFEDSEDFLKQTQAVSADELMVVKFWAPWCRACKGLEPKYTQAASQYRSFRFMQLNWEESKAFCKTIGVTALPLVKFFANGIEVESFPCGPKKVEILKGKLDEWNTKLGGSPVVRVVADLPDDDTDGAATAYSDAAEAAPVAAPAVARSIVNSEGLVDMRRINGRFLQSTAPALFGQLSGEQLSQLVASAVVTSYSVGDLITEQGDSGSRLFFLLSGSCDVFLDNEGQREQVNKLVAGSYFGERSIITGQPRCFTITAAEPNVKCLTFEKAALELVDPATWKTGNTFVPKLWGAEKGLVVSVLPPAVRKAASPARRSGVPVLVRFKLLRAAVRAFEYARTRTPNWGDETQRRFRDSLVEQLSETQVKEYKLAFALFDNDANGEVESWELAKALAIFGENSLTNAELEEMINRANPNVDGNTVMVESEFVALMAESEYSAFFLETFKLLDRRGFGWVEAGALKEVLEELKVLDDASRIDTLMKEFGVDDEGHINYEHFVSLMMSTSVNGKH